jgi:hypothetical protein
MADTSRTSMTLRIMGVVVALAVIWAACGNDRPAATPGDATPSASDTCLAGDPDCADSLEPLPDEEPIDLDPVTGEPIVRGLSVADVLATPIDGGFAMEAFYVDDGAGPRLCDALLESYPPQCGGDSIPLELSGRVIEGLDQEGTVTWSNLPVVVIGRVVDGGFVADPAGE